MTQAKFKTNNKSASNSKPQNKNIRFSLSFKEYHPPMWIYFWTSPLFLKSYRKISGTDVGFLYAIQNNDYEGHMQSNAAEVIHDSLAKKANVEFFDDLYHEYQKQLAKIIDMQANVAKYESQKKKLTDKQIIALTQSIYKTVSKVYPMSNSLYFFGDSVEKSIQEKSKQLNSAQKISITNYLHSSYPTQALSARAQLQRLKRKYFNANNGDAITVQDVSEAYLHNKTFRREMDAFVTKYKYLTSLNAGVRNATSFFQEIVTVPLVDKKPLKAPAYISHEIEVLNHIIFFKDEISTTLIPFVKYAFMYLWESIATRLGISLADLEQLHIDDIKHLLTASHDEINAFIAQRREFCGYVHMPFEESVITQGANALVPYKKLLTTLEESQHTLSENVVGRTGSAGKAKGKVQIIISSKNMSAFEAGNILVTQYTAPEFVPIMRKAIAIITDTGGATSHAAIVSRELGIPCVVGTKNATRVLKDGDIVEVDANAGVVRKI